MLEETNGSGVLQNFYIYGNYIDEVLIKYDTNWRFYAHDHLYSPAALLDNSANVLERYEYDAYGEPNVFDPDFSDDADGLSDYDNFYLFTGRRRSEKINSVCCLNMLIEGC